jgi:mono/diheme cytochrome c family protein
MRAFGLRIVTMVVMGAAMVLVGHLGAVPAATAADLANGKKVYQDKCARCHGDKGKGDGPKAETLEKKPADYTDKKKMGEFTDVQLKKITLDGKQPMPAYEGKMSAKDLDDCIAHIRTFAGK